MQQRSGVRRVNHETVSYQEYARELEKTKAKLEEKTCVKGISSRIWIVNIGTYDKIEMGINVSGTGNVSSIYAKAFRLLC